MYMLGGLSLRGSTWACWFCTLGFGVGCSLVVPTFGLRPSSRSSRWRACARRSHGAFTSLARGQKLAWARPPCKTPIDREHPAPDFHSDSPAAPNFGTDRWTVIGDLNAKIAP